MNGSVSFENSPNVPQAMPSGTPTIEDSRKPQKMSWMLDHRLWCSHGSLGSRGGVRNAVYKARATACGAGKNTGLARTPLASCMSAARILAFSAANTARSTSMSA